MGAVGVGTKELVAADTNFGVRNIGGKPGFGENDEIWDGSGGQIP